MAGQMLICECDCCRPAECCCYCRLPLPLLCTEHFQAKHSMDSGGFQHFHLPLEARDLIRSEADLRKYRLILFQLYINYCDLKADQERLMMQCEEDLEALRLEIENFAREMSAKCERGKEKLAVIRESFQLELRKAMREVCMHSLEEWCFEKGSLAGIIAGSKEGNGPIPGLFSYTLQGKFKEMRDFLRIQLSMALPTLSHLNYCDGIVEDVPEILISGLNLSSKVPKSPDFSAISPDVVPFPPIKEVQTSLSPTSCPYPCPEPGFSFLISCSNPKCSLNGHSFYIAKGFGVFNLAETSSNLACPSCRRKIREATTCGLYQAEGKFEGGLRNLEVVESLVLADSAEFRQLTEIGDREWRYITISCCPLQPNT